MIQQAINQGLSLAALVATQTQGYKTKARIHQIKREGARINRILQVTASDTSPEGRKARSAAVERGKELSAEKLALDPSEETFEQYKENIAIAEAHEADIQEQTEQQAQAEAEQLQQEAEQQFWEERAEQEPEPVEQSQYEVAEARAQKHLAERQKTKRNTRYRAFGAPDELWGAGLGRGKRGI